MMHVCRMQVCMRHVSLMHVCVMHVTNGDGRTDERTYGKVNSRSRIKGSALPPELKIKGLRGGESI